MVFDAPLLIPPADGSTLAIFRIRLNWTTPMGLTMRTIALTLNGMKIKPGEVFRGKITFK